MALLLADLHMPVGHDNPYLDSFVHGHFVTWWARHRVPAEQRPERYWRAFSAAITPHIRGVHPTISWQNGPTPAGRMARPVDAAWIALWDWATRGGHPPLWTLPDVVPS